MPLLKRINAFALICALLCGIMPEVSAKQDNVYFYEDFDGYSTNEINTSICLKNKQKPVISDYQQITIE